MAEPGSPKRPERVKPSEEQKKIIEYFLHFGLRLRKQLKILQDPRLGVGGIEAKKEGWFINKHSALESVLVMKIAELMQLGPNERNILLEAAMTHHAYKRIQYRRKDPWSQESYTQSQREGEGILRDFGVSEDTITVNKITDAVYFKEIAGGAIDIKSEDIVRFLQRILAFTHNSIDTRISRSDEAPKAVNHIIFWKDHLNEVRQRNVDIAGEVVTYKGAEQSYYDVEEGITAEIEEELKKKILEKNHEVHFDNTPLALQLRKLIMDDIGNDVLPKI